MASRTFRLSSPKIAPMWCHTGAPSQWAVRLVRAAYSPSAVMSISIGPRWAPESEGLSERISGALGWPVWLVHAQVVRGQALVEHRLCAAYRCFGYSTEVLARAADPDLAGLELPALRDVLLSGRPDWAADQVAALIDLWR